MGLRFREGVWVSVSEAVFGAWSLGNQCELVDSKVGDWVSVKRRLGPLRCYCYLGILNYKLLVGT